jgi:hypothetical protein
METLNFKDPNWLENVSEIHALVSEMIERALEKTRDLLWLKEAAAEDALALIADLDRLLRAQTEPNAVYLQKYGALFDILQELGLRSRVAQKIKAQFGVDCFFLMNPAASMR